MRDVARSRLGKCLAALLALTMLAACQKWTTVESPIASTVEKNEPGRVRVTTMDGRVMELDSPTVQGDSLTGSIAGKQQPMVAIAEIEKLEFRGSNVGLTVLSIAGAAAIVVAIVLATNPGNENP
ncbi:MAG: hypothetical protein ACYTA3_13260 [Planctomycetota bacterium]|jgi:hypothetical protein